MSANSRPATQPTTPGMVLDQLHELATILTRLPTTADEEAADYADDLHAALAPYLRHGRQLLTKDV